VAYTNATTSGTNLFNLDLAELVDEAFERCGTEVRSGYDMRTARRSLGILFMEWANRGINLWTINQYTAVTIAGTSTYTIPHAMVDVLDFVVRTGTGTGQIDLPITRISNSVYSSIPNKNTRGRPLQYVVNRRTNTGSDLNSLTIWPVPDSALYTLVWWQLDQIQDTGDGTNIQQVPMRFIPALVAGLAYYMSMKIPSALDRAIALKAVYDEQWQMAADEDREKNPLRLIPRASFIR